MDQIADNIERIRLNIPKGVTLVCVSKYHTNAEILTAFEAGERHFGESRVQELVAKQAVLPKDIHWHFIGHLQRNKVKFIIDSVDLIHGVDSLRLLQEVDKQAQKANRQVAVLLQVHIAEEESKFGFSPDELRAFFAQEEYRKFENVRILGLMGMATNTDDEARVRREFKGLKRLFDEVKKEVVSSHHSEFSILSMGMSGDYLWAIEEGSSLVRIGSAIFGGR